MVKALIPNLPVFIPYGKQWEDEIKKFRKIEIIDMLKRAYLYSNKLECCGNCSWLYSPSCARKKAGSFDHITLYNNLFPEPSACCGAWHMKLIQGKEDV